MSKNSKYIDLSCENGVRIIKLNRVNHKNAINTEMYECITNILNEDAVCDDVVVTILTGTGDYFSSGNDIKDSFNWMDKQDSRLEKVKAMVTAFVEYPKLLIAIVNGPAIGIAATVTALCDLVYATDNASFSVPFVRLGLCMEACSSATFPIIFGRSKTTEMVFLGKLLSAEDAYRYGFVSTVVPHNKVDEFIQQLKQYGNLSVEAVKRNKMLITDGIKNHFLACNNKEIELLKECIQSEDFINSVMKFINKKSKL